MSNETKTYEGGLSSVAEEEAYERYLNNKDKEDDHE
jgi:hypothetical protein